VVSGIPAFVTVFEEETTTAGAGIVRFCLGEHHLHQGDLLRDDWCQMGVASEDTAAAAQQVPPSN
jgi:hypothetical protein